MPFINALASESIRSMPMRENPEDYFIPEPGNGSGIITPDPTMIVTEMTEDDIKARLEKRKREK